MDDKRRDTVRNHLLLWIAARTLVNQRVTPAPLAVVHTSTDAHDVLWRRTYGIKTLVLEKNSPLDRVVERVRSTSQSELYDVLLKKLGLDARMPDDPPAPGTH